jgi:hypothetical protein
MATPKREDIKEHIIEAFNLYKMWSNYPPNFNQKYLSVSSVKEWLEQRRQEALEWQANHDNPQAQLYREGYNKAFRKLLEELSSKGDSEAKQ